MADAKPQVGDAVSVSIPGRWERRVARLSEVIVHYGVPDELRPDERPDLGAVRIVPLCGNVEVGSVMCTSWLKVTCKECCRRGIRC